MVHGKTSKCARPPRFDAENVDPLTAQVFQALGRVTHLHRLLMIRMISQRDVQHAEIMALPLLKYNEGLSQRELGEILHLSPPRVSIALQVLEKSGAIERRPDENDRRLVRVFLTDEGRRRQKEQASFVGDYVNRTIGALSEADRQELNRLLGELADRTTELLQEDQSEGSEREGAAAE